MDDVDTIAMLAVWFSACGLVAFVFVSSAKPLTETAAGRIIAGLSLVTLMTVGVIAPMEYRPTKDLICSSELVMLAVAVYCVVCFTPAMFRWKAHMQLIRTGGKRDA
jgi:hypothetical protein